MSADNEVLWAVVRSSRSGVVSFWIFRSRAAARMYVASKCRGEGVRFYIRAAKWGPEQ